MGTIKNYYEELNIQRDMSLEDINKELDQIENTWKMREMSNPEKAALYIKLIRESREVFESEESRKKYDDKLSMANEDIEEESLELVEYRKQIKKIKEFMDSEQFDVAKVTFEKTLSMIPSIQLDDIELCEFYHMGSHCCYMLDLNDEGIKYANEIISINPELLIGYDYKLINSYFKTFNLMERGEDYSPYYNDVLKAGFLLEKKANEQENDYYIGEASKYLMCTYWNFKPRNYDEVEKYANKLLELNQEVELANNVLKMIDEPELIGIEDLEKYKQEVSPYEDEINNMIRDIIESGLMPDTENGWELEKTSFYGWYPEDGDDEEEHREFTYYLKKDGKFKRWTHEEKEYMYKQGGMSQYVEDKYEDIDLNEVMSEMDFDVWWDADNGYGWEERSLSVWHIAGHWKPRSTNHIKKLYRKKGTGLYNKLKSIIDADAEYIEACRQANEEFSKEFEEAKKSIEDEYEVKRNKLLDEKEQELEKAKSNKSRRSELNSDIEKLQNELSSLGILAIGRKKELQSLIDDANRELATLLSEEFVEERYKEKFNGLKESEDGAISNLKAEIRSKYPLPQR